MKKLIGTILLLSFAMHAAAQTYDEIAAMAIDSASAGNYTAAERLFKQAIIESPNDPHNALLFSNLGNILWKTDKKRDAVAAYSSALNFVPLSVPILLQRGKLYIELGENREAMTDFGNVLDVNPNNEEALFFKAYLLAEEKNYKEAENTYKKLLGLNPEYKEASISLALLYNREKKYEDATKLISSLMVKYPDDHDILMARANTEFEMGHYYLALADLANLEEADSTNPDIYILRGNIYREKELYKEAIAEYEKAIALGVSRELLKENIESCKKKK